MGGGLPNPVRRVPVGQPLRMSCTHVPTYSYVLFVPNQDPVCMHGTIPQIAEIGAGPDGPMPWVAWRRRQVNSTSKVHHFDAELRLTCRLLSSSRHSGVTTTA